MKVQLTKQFDFEMAHALMNYDGHCKNIHGHSYKLYITVEGEPNPDEKSSKCGMVMDFGDLKKIVYKIRHKMIFMKMMEDIVKLIVVIVTKIVGLSSLKELWN